MKVIFVTGGVVSGLGKGITAASIGRLLKSADYRINILKMDPYLQVDAGTMSPYEHGEVFVTEDGLETDLDMGHYERFIDENLNGENNITSGKVYWDVINRERKGDYLGKTVQVVPHVIDGIKDRIKNIAANSDIAVVEVGGTVGDIESLPFLEAIRQIKDDLGENNVVYVHVTPLIYLKMSGELKTKAIQHSVKELRSIGIQADILVCRTEVPMDDKIKNKISLLCGVKKESVIEAIDAKSIYQVPGLFKKQNLDQLIDKQLNLLSRSSDLKKWSKIVEQLVNPKKDIAIGVVGKYVEFQDAYLSIMEACTHAGGKNSVKVHFNWIQSDDLEDESYKKILSKHLKKGELQGILIPGGFGGRGIEGKINAVRFAREKNIPFLGICVGLQAAVIEYARNICGLQNANSSEFAPKCKHKVIDIMLDQKNLKNKGGTMRLGTYPALLKPGTITQKLYKSEEIQERHRHRFEVNPKHHDILQDNGLIISGTSPNGKLVEFIELKDHPYFIATQGHPEFKSRPNNVHPLFDGLIKASVKAKL